MHARSSIGRSWHLSRWQTLLFAVAGFAIALAGLLAWRESRAAVTAVAWVQHTFSVLLRIDQLTSALADAETGQRGFLLTGDAAYLEPYENALPRVLPSFDALQAETADDAATQARLAQLEPLVTRKLSELESTIARARAEGRGAALEIIRTDVGINAMNSIRRDLAELRGEQSRLLRERLIARDGYLRSSRTYGLVVCGLGLAILAALIPSINQTIGARGVAERNARISEQRLRVTLESIGDAVIATDVAARVTYMNPVAEALTGWRRADAEDLPLDQVFRIVNECSRDGVESPVSKVMREGGIVGLANHTVLIARDGTERPIDDSGAPIRDGDGKLMGVVLVFRDVTARRLSEQARDRMLRAEAERESAQSASRAKDEFLAIVSHELRSPLAAARSWLELVRGETLEAAQRTRALETIERNLRHQSVLVSDLLDVSRIIAGRLMLDRVPTDLSALVREVVADHRAVAEANGLSLRHEPARAMIAMLDPIRVRQVLTNLLTNAIRFTPAGGTVDVELDASESDALLRVRDSGRGIPAHVLPRVFERFHQGDPASTREHGGLGLGLSIARHLVEAHGGEIVAESAGEGRGATFSVRFSLRDPLPAALRGGETVARPAAPRGNGRLVGTTVLLVEDHVDTRDAVELLLKSHGSRVLVADTVAAAVALLRDERPALVVSDLGLPHESGFVLIEHVRALDAERGMRTPAIAASGFASGEDRQLALAAGFDAYLSKPVELSALLAQIDTLLAG